MVRSPTQMHHNPVPYMYHYNVNQLHRLRLLYWSFVMPVKYRVVVNGIECALHLDEQLLSGRVYR